MKNPVVQITFTNGVGNNLFQFIYARLFAEKIDGVISVKYVNDSKYAKEFFLKQGIQLKTLSNPDHKLFGYFEDYHLYVDCVDKIRSWFAPVEKTNTKDLVLHLRLGDRLFLTESYREGIRINPEQYVDAIGQFEFDHLHIVTDMKLWQILTKEDLLKMKFHNNLKENVDCQKAVDYFNSIFEALNKFNPLVRYDQDISDDFDYIRSFDKILFQHGTLAWWASMLSKASKVGVYGPWRPQKGAKNKNLGQVPLSNWFQWC